MTIQPNNHWQFNNKKDKLAQDQIGGINGKLVKVVAATHGRIGHSVRMTHTDSRLELGKQVGRFGTSDFTVAFGFKLVSHHNQNDMDLIGTRSVTGHGNWFSLRLENKARRLFFEVDENSKGKNYAAAGNNNMTTLLDKKWHHIAITRKGRDLAIYVDGAIVAQGRSKSGVANITNSTVTKLGHWKRHTPAAHYEDLRFYRQALSAEAINALVTPVRRPLSEGEIELIGNDNASIVLSENTEDLARFGSNFKELRVGYNTGATLFKDSKFGGTHQKLFADIPDIGLSKLGGSPKSIKLWPAAGEPFTGAWTVLAPNGRYLVDGIRQGLTTTGKRWFGAHFRFHYNAQLRRVQLIGINQHATAMPRISAETPPSSLFVDESAGNDRQFAIFNQFNQWLALDDNDQLHWTAKQDERAIFKRLSKLAMHEGEVGALSAGEVALYTNPAYHGRVWIVSDQDQSGSFPDLSNFNGLHDVTSSIRLGPETGATLFRHIDFKVSNESKREEEIEDIVENVPDLREGQIGDNALSSLKIFRSVNPDELFTSITSKLSQDYRMVNDKLEEFSAYRTILRCQPEVTEVFVSATDLTEIEVEGETYRIDEVNSVTLKPNEVSQLMITSEADGLDTPGLKIRTAAMAENEFIIIFPNKEVQKQIAELEEDALWNATDTKGKLIVDHKKHSKSEVAAVQSTIRRAMSAIVHQDGAASVTNGEQTTEPAIAAANMGSAWELKFNSGPQPSTGKSPKLPGKVGLTAAVVSGGTKANNGIVEKSISNDAFAKLLSQAEPANGPDDGSGNLPVTTINGVRIQARGLRFFRRIRDAVKKAVRVVVGAVKNAINVVIETAEGVFKWVIDKVKEVVELVESIVEKVVESIKAFIEFLQFLFDWGDILDTKRLIVRTVNSAFDSASAMVDSAKPHVSRFVDILREGINDGTDDLIEMLGVDPEEVDDRKDLPEAAEWLFNKLLGGGKKSSARTEPTSTSSGGDITAASAFEEALLHLAQAFEASAGVQLEVVDGFVGVFERLITQPTRPQLALAEIIDTLRDVGLQFLDMGEQLALATLELVVGLIELLQDVLNFELRIPLVSQLFELIGGGKLTILNVFSLLIAIPMTVAVKLATGKAPAKLSGSASFPTQQPATAQRSLIAEPVALQANDDGASSASTDDQFRELIRMYGYMAFAADAVSGVAEFFLDLKNEPSEEPPLQTFFEYGSLLCAWLSFTSSFPGSPTVPGGFPYNIAHSDHNVTKTGDPQEYWDRVVWAWRTWVLCFETVHFGLATFKGTFPSNPVLDALKEQLKKKFSRRSEIGPSGLATVFALIDLALTSRAIQEIPDDEDFRGYRITAEIVPIMPNLLGVSKHLIGGPIVSKGLGVVSFASLITVFFAPTLIELDVAAVGT